MRSCHNLAEKFRPGRSYLLPLIIRIKLLKKSGNISTSRLSQIGLAFDGNYEALSHKIAFDKDLNRTICVDVRYVLWCIDKLGGAKNIINELKLVK